MKFYKIYNSKLSETILSAIFQLTILMALIRVATLFILIRINNIKWEFTELFGFLRVVGIYATEEELLKMNTQITAAVIVIFLIGYYYFFLRPDKYFSYKTEIWLVSNVLLFFQLIISIFIHIFITPYFDTRIIFVSFVLLIFQIMTYYLRFRLKK